MSEFWDELEATQPDEQAKSEAALDKLERGDWDPEEGEREYYRQTTTGDRGWRVQRGGKDMIRLDRGAKETCLPLRQGQWEREAEHRPLSRDAAAQIAFEADKRLCFALGLIGLARLEWHGLTQQHKRAWMLEGPSTPRVRHELYRAIFDVLDPLLED